MQRLWCGHEVGTDLEICQIVVSIIAEASVCTGAVEDLTLVFGAEVGVRTTRPDVLVTGLAGAEFRPSES